VYLDLLGHSALLLLVPAGFARAPVTLDSACVAFVSQPVVSAFAFFSITLNIVFILESFFLVSTLASV